MIGIIGRDPQEVKDFILERMDEWYHSDIYEAISGIEVRLTEIEEAIKSNTMLTKPQAKLLEALISRELEQRMDNWRAESSAPYLAVDTFSIYTDAWGIYCRPGTYSI